MILDALEHTVIFSQANDPFTTFVKEFKEVYSKWDAYNIVMNFSSVHTLSKEQLEELIPLSEKHLEKMHSFVVVSDAISYEDAPDELVVVPTIQEAKDLIEMDLIERDLGL